MKIGHVFRRSLSKDQSACLFGIPLCKLTDGEVLPKPIMVSTLSAGCLFVENELKLKINHRSVVFIFLETNCFDLWKQNGNYFENQTYKVVPDEHTCICRPGVSKTICKFFFLFSINDCTPSGTQ